MVSSSSPATHPSAMANVNSTTEYFELNSASVGARFAISVSTPLAYRDRGAAIYPVLYVLDGNTFGPIAETVSFSLESFDSDPVAEPCVQVNVGYCSSDAPRHAALRNRDFIPPGETVPDFFASHVRSRLGSDASETEIQQVVAQYSSGAADKFLRFLEHELHPLIRQRYAVDVETVGLFGYSAGGLFALYALTSPQHIFTAVGASSPGVHADDSAVFARYAGLVEARRRGVCAPVHLHVTLNTQELMGHVRLYRRLSINTLRFVDMVLVQPVEGLTVTSAITSDEGHYSGYVDAYRSFRRAWKTSARRPRP